MKEPHEIKEGLRKCLSDVNCMKNCPYVGAGHFDCGCIDALREDTLEYIDNLEERVAIMTERPVAHWVDGDGNLVPFADDGITVEVRVGGASCSNCGQWLTGSDEYTCDGKFCPSCGAEMIGKE